MASEKLGDAIDYARRVNTKERKKETSDLRLFARAVGKINGVCLTSDF